MMSNRNIMILTPMDGWHIEHFVPTEGQWMRCNSTMGDRCPFTGVPHMVTTDEDCHCGMCFEDWFEKWKDDRVKLMNELHSPKSDASIGQSKADLSRRGA